MFFPACSQRSHITTLKLNRLSHVCACLGSLQSNHDWFLIEFPGLKFIKIHPPQSFVVTLVDSKCLPNLQYVSDKKNIKFARIFSVVFFKQSDDKENKYYNGVEGSCEPPK